MSQTNTTTPPNPTSQPLFPSSVSLPHVPFPMSQLCVPNSVSQPHIQALCPNLSSQPHILTPCPNPNPISQPCIPIPFSSPMAQTQCSNAASQPSVTIPCLNPIVSTPCPNTTSQPHCPIPIVLITISQPSVPFQGTPGDLPPQCPSEPCRALQKVTPNATSHWGCHSVPMPLTRHSARLRSEGALTMMLLAGTFPWGRKGHG